MKFEKTEKEAYVNMGYEKEDEIATDIIEMHFIELPKFRKKEPNLSNTLEQWLCLIAGKGEEIKMIEGKNKEIKKTINVIEKMSMNEKEWELYQSRKMATLLYNTSIHDAKVEGREERNKRTD